MSGVFQNIDPPTPLTAFGAGGGHTRQGERGWGVNILEDVRHCSVLYICKYFVGRDVGEREGEGRDFPMEGDQIHPLLCFCSLTILPEAYIEAGPGPADRYRGTQPWEQIQKNIDRQSLRIHKQIFIFQFNKGCPIRQMDLKKKKKITQFYWQMSIFSILWKCVLFSRILPVF